MTEGSEIAYDQIGMVGALFPRHHLAVNIDLMTQGNSTCNTLYVLSKTKLWDALVLKIVEIW